MAEFRQESRAEPGCRAQRRCEHPPVHGLTHTLERQTPERHADERPARSRKC